MSEHTTAPRPDVTDMYAVHGVFRDTLGAAPTLVGGIAPGDAERVALIANYYENILWFLEAHHDGEEELVFPLLRERCAGEDALIDEHGRAAPGGGRSCWRRPRPRWRPGRRATPAPRRRPRTRSMALHDQLVRHLDEEEERVLPLAAANLSMEEWGALPGHGMANFHGDKIWLILG